jgi:hypothetical protein
MKSAKKKPIVAKLDHFVMAITSLEAIIRNTIRE